MGKLHEPMADGGGIQFVEVGKRYPGLVPPMMQGGHYGYDIAGHLLRVFLPGATGSEVRGVRRGQAEFALCVEGPVIFLLFRFDGMLWSEATFSIHLVPEERRRTTLRSADSGERRNLLYIHLIDTRSGILKAARVCGLSFGFVDAFEVALQDQLAGRWRGREAYDAKLAEIDCRYPHDSDGIARKSIARCAFLGD